MRDLNLPQSGQADALRVLGRATLRLPDSLPNPARPAARLACSTTGPGEIPPPGSQLRAPRVEIRAAYASRRLRGVVVELRTDRGTVTNVYVQLVHHGGGVAHTPVARLGSRGQRVILRDRGHLFPPGRYVVRVQQEGRKLAEREVVVAAGRATPAARFVG